jgi:hypothetical protein
MSGFTLDVCLMWTAIGGCLTVAVIADTLVLLSLAARCWTMLMEQS